MRNAVNLTHDAHFYPRSPCGERQKLAETINPSQENFYPRSPCGERRRLRAVQNAQIDISIHALLAESDRPKALKSRRIVISIHALLAESDSQ